MFAWEVQSLPLSSKSARRGKSKREGMFGESIIYHKSLHTAWAMVSMATTKSAEIFILILLCCSLRCAKIVIA